MGSEMCIRDRQANGQIQMTMFGIEPHPLLDKIRSLEPTEMTPMNALEMLHQWQQELTEPSDAEASDVKKERVEQ